MWPENWVAFQLLIYMQTQWRIGMNGPTGLDYNVMYQKMGRMKLSESEYDELEDDMQTLELAALQAIRTKD